MIRLSINVVTGLAVVLVLAACSSDGGTTVIQRATAFAGGALVNFGGNNAADADARAVARDLGIGREYDLVNNGFAIASGNVTSAFASADPLFGNGTGTQTVAGDIVTVTLTVASNDTLLSDVTLTGVYSLSQAQAAISDAGRTFVINWTFDYQNDGAAVNITAEQTAYGTSWTTV
ncbi:hypothetical protein JW859_09095 [bacterium]|nr:hypothetical protein [bacterium]